jgi:hypothetical protein
MELDQEDTQGGLRADGRRASELRQIRMRMGVFGQADGSAYIEHGNTKVLATVYGPHQVNINYYKVFTLLIIMRNILYLYFNVHILLYARYMHVLSTEDKNEHVF